MKKVSVICVDCEYDYIDTVLIEQAYPNLEIVEAVTGKEFYQDIVEYCKSTDSDYVCFLEPGQRMRPDKIQSMVEYAEKMPDAEVIFCNRNYIEEDGAIAAHPDCLYRGGFQDKVFDGSQILKPFSSSFSLFFLLAQQLLYIIQTCLPVCAAVQQTLCRMDLISHHVNK